MRTYISINQLTILILVSISLLFCLSCDVMQEQQYSEYEAEEEIVFDRTVFLGEIPLPPGTKMTYEGKNTAFFELPEGFIFSAKNKDGEIVSLQRGGYNCTCEDASGGCNVFKRGDLVGCSHGSCSGTCNGSYVGDPPNQKLVSQPHEQFISLYEMELIDLTTGITFKSSTSENFSCTSDLNLNRIFALPQFENYLVEFSKESGLTSFLNLADEKMVAQEYHYAIVDFFGATGFIPISMDEKNMLTQKKSDVHNDLKKHALYKTTLVTTQSISCECEESGPPGNQLKDMSYFDTNLISDLSSGNCDRKRRLGVDYCEAGRCTSCTMYW